MSIYGVGIDIVNIIRFKSILNKNNIFKQRIFSKGEINYCQKKKNKISCLAMRYAAKEAFSKALGTGITNGISFKEIEVKNNKIGKPNINIKGKSKLIVKKILKKNSFKSFVSLSDDKPCAIAIVVISL